MGVVALILNLITKLRLIINDMYIGQHRILIDSSQMIRKIVCFFLFRILLCE